MFSKWPVTGIMVEQGTGVLHLKSMSSMCSVETIAISDTSTGQRAWKEIESQGQYKYRRLAFPEDNGANCCSSCLSMVLSCILQDKTIQKASKCGKLWSVSELSFPTANLLRLMGLLLAIPSLSSDSICYKRTCSCTYFVCVKICTCQAECCKGNNYCRTFIYTMHYYIFCTNLRFNST